MTAAPELDPSALRAALDDLVVRGAEVWDAPAVALVRTLLTKAETLDGVGRAHLLKRASTRFEALAEEFERARARADQTYAQLVQKGLDPNKRLDSARQYGRFDELARAAKRHDETRVASRQAIVRPWLERLSHEAHKRGLSQPPPPLEASGEPLVASEHETATGLSASIYPHETVTGLAAAIYQDAAADATARLVVAQATAELPAHAGRYHAPSVAARTLEALDALAPAYLRVQVARLEAIGALQRGVMPPPPQKPARGAKPGAKPKTTKAEVAKAEVAKPEAVKPKATKPKATKPKATKRGAKGQEPDASGEASVEAAE